MNKCINGNWQNFLRKLEYLYLCNNFTHRGFINILTNLPQSCKKITIRIFQITGQITAAQLFSMIPISIKHLK